MNISDIHYDSIKEKDVVGRYVNHHQLESFLKKEHPKWSVLTEGSSFEGREIYSLTFGQGTLRILMWSQMHGNESTTTRALFDLINSLNTNSEITKKLHQQLTIKIIPMLNPDGAFRYTRVNANEIDLNRDTQLQSQPESRILKDIYTDFDPDYCFNLHGQRTIYSAGDDRRPATLSFLSPAADKKGSLTPARVKSMKLIAAIHGALLPLLGPNMGRYDDSFNLECVGDTLQSGGTPTLLFEAGHFPGDYPREETRKYMWYALLVALNVLTSSDLDQYTTEDYNSIPSNQKKFFDILIRNVKELSEHYEQGDSVGILFKEVLRNSRIEFHPAIEEVGELHDRFGHVEYDCSLANELHAIKSDPSLSSLLFN